jgi:hypothetical protein
MWGLLQTVAGGLLALVGGFFGNRWTVRAEDRRWRASVGVQRNDRTADRLRKIYGPLVQSTATIQAIAHERQFVTTADGNVNKRDERHAKELAAAHTLVSSIGGEILVDKDARPLRERYNAFRKQFDEYIVFSETAPPGGDRATTIKGMLETLSKQAMEIQEFAEDHLDRLDALPPLSDKDDNAKSEK